MAARQNPHRRTPQRVNRPISSKPGPVDKSGRASRRASPGARSLRNQSRSPRQPDNTMPGSEMRTSLPSVEPDMRRPGEPDRPASQEIVAPLSIQEETHDTGLEQEHRESGHGRCDEETGCK